MSICAILLAAGAARRMRGADKLTQDVGGIPLLQDRADMLAASDADRVVVVLPEEWPLRKAALEGRDVVLAVNKGAANGMASSIQVGLHTLPPDCNAALIMPADMPDLTTEDINKMLGHHHDAPNRIHRATTQEGAAGSPVIFPSTYFPALHTLSGDESGRAVIQAHRDQVRLHALPDDRARLDLDTPEDWAAWRSAQRK